MFFSGSVVWTHRLLASSLICLSLSCSGSGPGPGPGLVSRSHKTHKISVKSVIFNEIWAIRWHIISEEKSSLCASGDIYWYLMKSLELILDLDLTDFRSFSKAHSCMNWSLKLLSDLFRVFLYKLSCSNVVYMLYLYTWDALLHPDIECWTLTLLLTLKQSFLLCKGLWVGKARTSCPTVESTLLSYILVLLAQCIWGTLFWTSAGVLLTGTQSLLWAFPSRKHQL